MTRIGLMRRDPAAFEQIRTAKTRSVRVSVMRAKACATVSVSTFSGFFDEVPPNRGRRRRIRQSRLRAIGSGRNRQHGAGGRAANVSRDAKTCVFVRVAIQFQHRKRRRAQAGPAANALQGEREIGLHIGRPQCGPCRDGDVQLVNSSRD